MFVMRGYDSSGKCRAIVKDHFTPKLRHVLRMVRGAVARGIEIKYIRC